MLWSEFDLVYQFFGDFTPDKLDSYAQRALFPGPFRLLSSPLIFQRCPVLIRVRRDRQFPCRRNFLPSL